MKTDLNGREYLKLEEARPGMVVELDSGFECFKASTVTLMSDNEGLYFYCTAGLHYIHSQCNSETSHCIGMYKCD